MPIKKIEREKESKGEKITQKEKYHEAVGRRKSSTARVRMLPVAEKSQNHITINSIDFEKYFRTNILQAIVKEAIKLVKPKIKFNISVLVKGGGISSQAQAVRHGIARILSKLNDDDKKRLKKAELLKRDSRAKERRKFGLKKARKAAQWSKR